MGLCPRPRWRQRAGGTRPRPSRSIFHSWECIPPCSKWPSSLMGPAGHVCTGPVDDTLVLIDLADPYADGEPDRRETDLEEPCRDLRAVPPGRGPCTD